MTQFIARRSVLKAIAAGISFLSAPFVLRAAETPPAAPTDLLPGWSFEGVTGPDHWSELSPDNALCQFGIEQSPVDLVDAAKVGPARALLLDYRPVTARVVSADWTLQVVLDPGCSIAINGRRYALEHILFRRPSEHLLSGRALEMELQLVHRAEGGAIAIVAVFVRQGKKNEILERIIAGTPTDAAQKLPLVPINPLDLLPVPPLQSEEARAFYRYMGSLTTPPCTEGVNWTVLKTPIEASPKQIRELATLFPVNARPANKINRRFLLEYGS
jgi:carbonic anhydrase